jgi:predicted flavoprotein YhiN
MTRHFGRPIKNLRLSAGSLHSRGEIVLTAKGIEGGGLYPLTPALREGAPLVLDLKPDLTVDQVRTRLAVPRKDSLANRLRKALRLDPAQIALIRECGYPLPNDLAPMIKSLTIRHHGAQDIDGAISTAGGLRWDALDPDLMLRHQPGTFACGEMLDWEAPTGGHLLTACLATGRWAGAAAAAYARNAASQPSVASVASPGLYSAPNGASQSRAGKRRS